MNHNVVKTADAINRQNVCVANVRKYLVDNKFSFDEKSCPTGTTYFYVNINSNFSRVKIRVSDHSPAIDKGDINEDKWKFRGYTTCIRSDDPRFQPKNQPYKYVSKKVYNAIWGAQQYGLKKAFANI